MVIALPHEPYLGETRHREVTGEQRREMRQRGEETNHMTALLHSDVDDAGRPSPPTTVALTHRLRRLRIRLGMVRR